MTVPWVPIELVPWGFAGAEGLWSAPPTGAPLARQGRFASLRDDLRPPLTREPLCALMAAERAGQGPARRRWRGPEREAEAAPDRPTETSVDPAFVWCFGRGSADIVWRLAERRWSFSVLAPSIRQNRLLRRPGGALVVLGTDQPYAGLAGDRHGLVKSTRPSSRPNGSPAATALSRVDRRSKASRCG